MGKKSETYPLGLNHEDIGVWVVDMLRPCFSSVTWSSCMQGLRQHRGVGLGPNTVDRQTSLVSVPGGSAVLKLI